MSTATMYEAKIEHDDYGTYLFMYLGRKSGRGLRDAFRNNHMMIGSFAGEGDWFTSEKAADGIESDTGWRIKFTGRTRRDAENEGELPWYRDEVAHAEVTASRDGARRAQYETIRDRERFNRVVREIASAVTAEGGAA